MSCRGKVKCKNENCGVSLKPCKMKSGLCPKCYSSQNPNNKTKSCKI